MNGLGTMELPQVERVLAKMNSDLRIHGRNAYETPQLDTQGIFGIQSLPSRKLPAAINSYNISQGTDCGTKFIKSDTEGDMMSKKELADILFSASIIAKRK